MGVFCGKHFMKLVVYYHGPWFLQDSEEDGGEQVWRKFGMDVFTGIYTQCSIREFTEISGGK